MRIRPLILLAVIALIVGCEKAPEAPKELPEVYTMKDNSYMDDPVFQLKLQELREARGGVVNRREKILSELASLDEGASAKREELTKRLNEMNEELENIRQRVIVVSRDRMNQALSDSKLVEEGKAKAK